MAFGINVGPSTGFFGRMMNAMPGAVNAAAQQYGGQFKGMARGVGGMMKDGQASFKNPLKRDAVPSNGPNGMPPSGPTPESGRSNGIVRMPSLPIFGNPGGVLGPNGLPRNGNTGITGGMFPGGIRIQPDMPNIGGGGLWNVYNNLSNETGVPQRQLFY